MNRSKKIIYGGIAAVVVVVVMVFFAWPKHIDKIGCVPTKSKPDVKFSTKNVGSDQAKVIANLAGYVQFHDDNTYLPLEIDSVSIDKSDPNNNVVTLSGPCQTIDVTYAVPRGTIGNLEYTYSSLVMMIKRDKQGEKRACNFDKPFAFGQPTAKRYSCLQEQAHQCSIDPEYRKDDKHVVSLVLDSFQLELDAADSSVKKMEFGKDPWPNSCKKWSDA